MDLGVQVEECRHSQADGAQADGGNGSNYGSHHLPRYDQSQSMGGRGRYACHDEEDGISTIPHLMAAGQ